MTPSLRNVTSAARTNASIIIIIIIIIISARQHIICYSALCYRPSVCPSVRPSVCLSVTHVDQSKTVEVRITQPSPQSSPWL